LEFDLNVKRLGLVKEIARSASRVAFLYVPEAQIVAAEEVAQKRIGDAGASLGIQVRRFGIRGRNDLAGAFAAMARDGTDAVIVNLDALLAVNYGEIATLALQYRLPTFGGARQFVEAGGAYGVNVDDAYRHATVFVDKILKGAKPADLPIKQPTKLEFIVNLKSAKALGLTIPQSLLPCADEVIQ
jgi:putative ABC transport system substrate-binding protein